MMALVPPPAELKSSAVIQDLPPHMMSATFKTEVASVPPGQEVVIPYILYFGPKDRAILASVGHGLERAGEFRLVSGSGPAAPLCSTIFLQIFA